MLRQQFVIFENLKPSNFWNVCFYRFPTGGSAPTLKTACFNFITLTFLTHSVVLFTQLECKRRQFQDVHWRVRIKMSQKRTGTSVKKIIFDSWAFYQNSVPFAELFFFPQIFFFLKIWKKILKYFFFFVLKLFFFLKIPIRSQFFLRIPTFVSDFWLLTEFLD